MFEKAARLKLRFNFKGILNVEDLWDLSLESLDLIYKNLSAEAKKFKETSLLDIKTEEDEVIALKLTLVEYVFKTLAAEKQARKDAFEIKARKAKILNIIAEKEDEGLKNMSLDELKKLVE